MAIKKAGGNKKNVFVVSIPDYGYTPFGQQRQKEISDALDEFNEVNKEITLARGIAYFNITEISRDGLKKPELVAGDRLHPSGAMYKLWVEEIMKGIRIR
jgi:lysophospholipase L1-like esterase